MPAWRLLGTLSSIQQHNSRVGRGNFVLTAVTAQNQHNHVRWCKQKHIIVHASFPSGTCIVATARQPERVTTFVSPVVHACHPSEVAASKQGNVPGGAGVLCVMRGGKWVLVAAGFRVVHNGRLPSLDTTVMSEAGRRGRRTGRTVANSAFVIGNHPWPEHKKG